MKTVTLAPLPKAMSHLPPQNSRLSPSSKQLIPANPANTSQQSNPSTKRSKNLFIRLFVGIFKFIFLFIYTLLKWVAKIFLLCIAWSLAILIHLFLKPFPDTRPKLKRVSPEEAWYLTPEEIRKKNSKYYEEYEIQKEAYDLVNLCEITLIIGPTVYCILKGNYLMAFITMVLYALYLRYIKPLGKSNDD